MFKIITSIWSVNGEEIATARTSLIGDPVTVKTDPYRSAVDNHKRALAALLKRDHFVGIVRGYLSGPHGHMSWVPDQLFTEYLDSSQLGEYLDEK